MESLGKQVSIDGEPLPFKVRPAAPAGEEAGEEAGGLEQPLPVAAGANHPRPSASAASCWHEHAPALRHAALFFLSWPPLQAGEIIFGEPGTNGQHSFYQLLHQGTSTVACDILVVAKAAEPIGEQQDMLVANALAQAAVLSRGRTADEVRADGTPEALVAHKVMPGNRPTSVLLIEELDPFTLGALVALYEHSVFVQGSIWGIDSFDQWGVELGKKVAQGILGGMRSGRVADSGLDPATLASVEAYLALRG